MKKYLLLTVTMLFSLRIFNIYGDAASNIAATKGLGGSATHQANLGVAGGIASNIGKGVGSILSYKEKRKQKKIAKEKAARENEEERKKLVREERKRLIKQVKDAIKKEDLSNFIKQKKIEETVNERAVETKYKEYQEALKRLEQIAEQYRLLKQGRSRPMPRKKIAKERAKVEAKRIEWELYKKALKAKNS